MKSYGTRNEPKKVRILSSEPYAQSRERIEYLQDIVVEGEEAKIVLKYASKFLEMVERETLDNLAKKDVDHEEAAKYYQAASRFVDNLKAAVSYGEKKADTLSKLKESASK